MPITPETAKAYLHAKRGVVSRLLGPLGLWKAQCDGWVSASALPAGHFIPEELPEATALALQPFFIG